MNMGIFLLICVFFNYIHQGPLFFLLFSALSASQQGLPILKLLAAFFEPIPCPAVRYHFWACVWCSYYTLKTVCFCTHPKTKSFLWTVPCQIYLGCTNVRLEKHCLEYSWFLIHDFKRINVIRTQLWEEYCEISV